MRSFRSPIAGFVLSVLALAFTAHPTGADATSGTPHEIVERFHDGLTHALEQPDNDTALAPFDALCPVLKENMAIRLQGAASVGRRAWNAWTPEQRDTYSQRFEDYLCAQYADRFKDYRGEGFVIVGERPGPRGTVIIQTEVRVPGGKPVPIDYVVRSTADGWAIADLFLDGTVSEVALRRAEFSAILRDQGFDALVTLMTEKSQEWAREIP